MQTAAWITLVWLRQLTEVLTPGFFINKIKPGNLKSIYLKHWIKENYSSKLLEHPLWIQAAFTLPAHDNISDVIHASSSQLYNCSQSSLFISIQCVPLIEAHITLNELALYNLT